jgi:hypothetical protein
MTNGINSVLLERAEMVRDMEYTKCIVEDAEINDAIDSVKHMCPDAFDSTEFTDEQLDDAIDQIPDDDADRNEEINRIAQADHDMSIDDVMGLSDDIEDEESEDL